MTTQPYTLSEEEMFLLIGNKRIVVAEVMQSAYALGIERGKAEREFICKKCGLRQSRPSETYPTGENPF